MIAPSEIIVSYNYDFLTGILTPGTATLTALSVGNVFLSVVADPHPPDPNGGGTFIGTAHPFQYQGDEVVYEQSTCPTYPTCFFDGTFTYAAFVMRNTNGLMLELIAALSRVSDQPLEAWFTVVVKTKVELTEAKRFLHGPLTRFHKSLLAEIQEREERRNQIE